MDKALATEARGRVLEAPLCQALTPRGLGDGEVQGTSGRGWAVEEGWPMSAAI